MVRLKVIARFYAEEADPADVTAELRTIVQEWNYRLAQESFAYRASTREEGRDYRVLDDHIRRVSTPLPWFPLHFQLRGGHWYRFGYPFFLRTTSTPKKPRCYHRPLQDVEFAPLVFYSCLDCGIFVRSENCGHVYNAKFFGKKKRAKSKYRAVPTAGDDTPNNGSEFDPRGESDAVGITETDGQWIAKFEWMWKLNQRPDPVPVIERRWHWKNIDTDSAPEIEYRVQRAASRYFDLSVPPRYRAPHAKVRELSKKGLTQKQIARKLKVKERTIRNRLAELPPEPPKETIAADLLPLIVARGGGWAKGNSWPGGENTPRGSTESHPQDADQLGTRKGAEWISPRNDGNFNHAVDYQADGYARFSLPWTGCSHPAYALECSPVRCGRCGAEC